MNIFLDAPRQEVVTAPSNSSGLTDSERQLPQPQEVLPALSKTRRGLDRRPQRKQNVPPRTNLPVNKIWTMTIRRKRRGQNNWRQLAKGSREGY